MKFRVGYIYGRSYIQKKFVVSGCVISPLAPTGFAGEIHDVRKKLNSVGFNYSRKDLDARLNECKDFGHCTLVEFFDIEAPNYVEAIEGRATEAEDIIGAVSVISANPAVAFCAFAQSAKESGIKFFTPSDRRIMHGTNVPGYLDALQNLVDGAKTDAKLSLLFKLFRSSLREREIDNQILFQLILFEEASDNEHGVFGDRLRKFSEKIGFLGDLTIIARDTGVTLPEGKDVIDLIVKLRNAAAHNGNISEESLKEFNGDWVVPIIKNKEQLHKLITEAIRYMFVCLVGHTRDKMAMKITGTDPFVMRFD